MADASTPQKREAGEGPGANAARRSGRAYRLWAGDLAGDLVAYRHHLHAHPELSFEERATQAYLISVLAKAGLPEPRPTATTGLTFDVVGEGPASAAPRCVAVRADIDALPIHEVDGRPYGSETPGVMHACGHDVHTACALGAARLLYDSRAEWSGTVRFIFQPGEELLPGGATMVIADGVLAATPPVEAIVGLHVAPDLPVGTLGLRSGAYMASTDELYLSLHGDGGHAALAHRHTDLVAAAAQIVTALQQVVSRKAPPQIPSVLSFGKINSHGGATNVLTARIDLEGTFRTYDEAWRGEAHAWIRRIAEGVGASLGARVELDLRRGYPALSNDAEVTATVGAVLRGVVGEDAVAALDLRPTAEDFAWYLRHVPGCFFRLGVRNEALGITAGVHTPEFDVDEACLPVGAAALAAAARSLLERP